MRVRFEAADTVPRWARTEGLAALEQAEIVVPLQWLEDAARDRQVARLLEFIEAYVRTPAPSILAGQTLTYGWTTLRFSRQDKPPIPGAHECLTLHELRDPFGLDDTTFVAGAARAIALVETQERALQRNHITGVAEHPHRMHLAIVCAEVISRSDTLADALVLERTEHIDLRDSGWVLRCVNPGHDHEDPAELHRVHLRHLVSLYPVTFSYLAMPIGTAIMLSHQEVIVFPPGENAGVPDPDPLRQIP